MTAKQCHDALRTRRLGIGVYEVTTHDGEVFTVADFYPDESGSSLGRRQWGIYDDHGEPLNAHTTLSDCKFEIAWWTFYRLNN